MKTTAARRSTLLALLQLLRRNADYRRLFLSAVISFLGDWFAFVAVSGFVTESTGRAGLSAVVYAASVLPVFLLSPVAGVVADRVDRKKLIVSVDFARVPVALALVPAMWWDLPWLAIGLVGTLAALSTFFEPVLEAVVPNVVDEEDLSLAQAALGSTWGTMLFVGAAFGGLVAAFLGREASFVINAATFLVSAILVLGVRRPLQEARASVETTFVGHLGEAAKFIRAHKVTKSLLITKAGVGLASGIVGLLPAYASSRFGKGDAGVGMLLAARGLGALLGPLMAHAFVRGDGRRLFFVCGASMIGYGAAYAFLPLTSSLSLAVACVILAHLGGGAQWLLSTYGLQVTTPDVVRGRILSIDFGLATLSIGVSSLVAAGVAEVTTLETSSWMLATTAGLMGFGWLFWTRRLWWKAAVDPLSVRIPPP